jgi:glycosyltransferase involved in cell wall biosynthesis
VKVLIVSGIWPPDVGGPASHAPDVADFLHERGHEVEVVTTASTDPEPRAYPVRWTSRGLPKGVLHARAAALVRSRAVLADIVYTTGMFGRSTAAALVARVPYVVKLTADPAFERARRRGEVEGEVEEFQGGGGGLRAAAYRRARDAELQHAAHVITPSAWLRDLAISWGVEPERVTVLPNPAPLRPAVADRAEAKLRLGLGDRSLAFAGRLTAQKSLDVAVRAVAAVEGVVLVIAGEGPDREPLERLSAELGVADRVRFLGPLPREEVLDLFAAADAAILSSSWENAPHTVVEALSLGTPVLATATGGVAEVVRHEENGLLVGRGDAEALGAAVRRYFDEDDLRERLRSAAAESVADYAPEQVLARLESILAQAARPG